MLMPEVPLNSEQRLYEGSIRRRGNQPKRSIPDTLINLEDSGDFIQEDSIMGYGEPLFNNHADGETQTE